MSMTDGELVVATRDRWRELTNVFICGPGAADASIPEPCDCGFVGWWQYRFLYDWHAEPGHRRTDEAIRRDLAKGLPARARDEGWWVIAGSEERCPGCGDIERFDRDHNLIEAEINEVGKRRRAEALRRNADLIEEASELRVRAAEIEAGTIPAERVRVVDTPALRLLEP